MSNGEENELDLLEDNILKIIEAEDAQVYSKAVIDEFRNPHNPEKMSDPDGYGIEDGLCGDSMEIFIRVKDGKISRCSFWTSGCGASIACGSRLARFVEGMGVESALCVTGGDILSLLGGLPRDHEHCATLAVMALRKALRDIDARGERTDG